MAYYSIETSCRWLTLPSDRVIEPKLRLKTNNGIHAVLLLNPDEIPSFPQNWTQWRIQTNSYKRIINSKVIVNVYPSSLAYVGAFMEVEFSGLGGSLAGVNGVHLLAVHDTDSSNLQNTIYWEDKEEGDEIASAGVYWAPDKGICYATAAYPEPVTAAGCYKEWTISVPLSPTLEDFEGYYTESDCDDTFCSDESTCEKSAGATCRVRWAGATWP